MDIFSGIPNFGCIRLCSFMNQGIARTMMDYRTDRLEAACQKALSYGYDGAMFPWESDDAGEEACPTWALTGPF